jgi:hypothetical protein
MVTTIRINDDPQNNDKQRFDNLKRTLSYKKQKDLSQEEVVAELLNCYIEYKEVEL